MDFKILDVGCGNMPRGDVNVDLYPKATGHRSIDQRKLGLSLDLKRIRNFINADGIHLPFKDNAFNLVVSYHTIEHSNHPFQFLKELIRVSKRKVIVVCPHRFGDPHRTKVLHVSHLDRKWFQKALEKIGVSSFQMHITQYRNFPFNKYYLPYLFRVPLEIKVVINK